jgi:hypothetical protein
LRNSNLSISNISPNFHPTLLFFVRCHNLIRLPLQKSQAVERSQSPDADKLCIQPTILNRSGALRLLYSVYY